MRHGSLPRIRRCQWQRSVKNKFAGAFNDACIWGPLWPPFFFRFIAYFQGFRLQARSEHALGILGKALTNGPGRENVFPVAPRYSLGEKHSPDRPLGTGQYPRHGLSQTAATHIRLSVSSHKGLKTMPGRRVLPGNVFLPSEYRGAAKNAFPGKIR